MARTKEFDGNRALDDAVGEFREKGNEATSIQDLVNATGEPVSGLRRQARTVPEGARIAPQANSD